MTVTQVWLTTWEDDLVSAGSAQLFVQRRSQCESFGEAVMWPEYQNHARPQKVPDTATCKMGV